MDAGAVGIKNILIANQVIGDSVLLVPGHCCTTANLHDYYFCVRNGVVEDVWPIEARGKLE